MASSARAAQRSVQKFLRTESQRDVRPPAGGGSKQAQLKMNEIIEKEGFSKIKNEVSVDYLFFSFRSATLEAVYLRHLVSKTRVLSLYLFGLTLLFGVIAVAYVARHDASEKELFTTPFLYSAIASFVGVVFSVSSRLETFSASFTHFLRSSLIFLQALAFILTSTTKFLEDPENDYRVGSENYRLPHIYFGAVAYSLLTLPIPQKWALFMFLGETAAAFSILDPKDFELQMFLTILCFLIFGASARRSDLTSRTDFLRYMKLRKENVGIPEMTFKSPNFWKIFFSGPRRGESSSGSGNRSRRGSEAAPGHSIHEIEHAPKEVEPRRDVDVLIIHDMDYEDKAVAAALSKGISWLCKVRDDEFNDELLVRRFPVEMDVRKLTRTIEVAPLVVFVMSSAALARGRLRPSVEFAHEKRKPTVAITIGEVSGADFPKGFHMILKKTLFVLMPLGIKDKDRVKKTSELIVELFLRATSAGKKFARTARKTPQPALGVSSPGVAILGNPSTLPSGGRGSQSFSRSTGSKLTPGGTIASGSLSRKTRGSGRQKRSIFRDGLFSLPWFGGRTRSGSRERSKSNPKKVPAPGPDRNSHGSASGDTDELRKVPTAPKFVFAAKTGPKASAKLGTPTAGPPSGISSFPRNAPIADLVAGPSTVPTSPSPKTALPEEFLKKVDASPGAAPGAMGRRGSFRAPSSSSPEEKKLADLTIGSFPTASSPDDRPEMSALSAISPADNYSTQFDDVVSRVTGGDAIDFGTIQGSGSSSGGFAAAVGKRKKTRKRSQMDEWKSGVFDGASIPIAVEAVEEVDGDKLSMDDSKSLPSGQHPVVAAESKEDIPSVPKSKSSPVEASPAPVKVKPSAKADYTEYVVRGFDFFSTVKPHVSSTDLEAEMKSPSSEALPEQSTLKVQSSISPPVSVPSMKSVPASPSRSTSPIAGAGVEESKYGPGPEPSVMPFGESGLQSSMLFPQPVPAPTDKSIVFRKPSQTTLARTFTAATGRSASRSVMGTPSTVTPVVISGTKTIGPSSIPSLAAAISGGEPSTTKGLQMMMSTSLAPAISVAPPKVIIDLVEVDKWTLQLSNLELETAFLQYRKGGMAESANLIITLCTTFLLLQGCLSSIVFAAASNSSDDSFARSTDSGSSNFTILLALLGPLIFLVSSRRILMRNELSIHATEHTILIFFFTFVLVESFQAAFWVANHEAVTAYLFLDSCVALFFGITLFQMTFYETLLAQFLVWGMVIFFFIADNVFVEDYNMCSSNAAEISGFSIRIVLAVFWYTLFGRITQYRSRMLFLMDQRLATENIGIDFVHPEQDLDDYDHVNKRLIFISYKRQDKAFAIRIEENLKRCGYEVWIDKQIRPGENWRDEICEAIEASAVVLFIVSPQSVVSRYCMEELEHAYHIQKPILPVTLRDAFSVMPEHLKMMIASVQMVNFEGKNFTDSFRELTLALHRIVSRSDDNDALERTYAKSHDDPVISAVDSTAPIPFEYVT